MNGLRATRVLAAGIGAFLFGSREARAEAPWAIGLVPSLGGGAAVMTSARPLPGFIGYTDLGLEFQGEIRPWGGFLRGDFLSSGQDGRWTAVGLSLGGTRRVWGDADHLSLLARGGLVYERWHGQIGGCPIDLFVPSGCELAQPPPGSGIPASDTQTFSVSSDTFGILAGARLQLPISAAYVAFDASFVPTVNVDSGPPGAVLQMRFDVVFGFRDRRILDRKDVPDTRRVERHRVGD